MADVASLLPRNGTAVLRAIEQATAYDPHVADAVDAIANVKGQLLPSFLSFLLYEYGLIELSPYVPNAYALLGDGRQWEIERGTFAAMTRGLGWLGVTAAIDEAPDRRSWWNSFQLILSALPPADSPNLARIERVAGMSSPFRSDFRRGVFGYDAGPMELAYGRLGQALLGTESGVRLHAGGPLWSFGVPTEIDHLLTEDEGTALGIWVDPPEGESLTWHEINEPWTAATFAWSSSAATARATLMAQSLAGRAAYFKLAASDGTVIGFRRARLVAAVSANSSGPFKFGALKYVRDGVSPTLVYFEALTAFGDGAGQQAAAASVLINPDLAAGIPPGRDWVAPGGVSGGVEIAMTDAAIDLRPTVRQQIKVLLRF